MNSRPSSSPSANRSRRPGSFVQVLTFLRQFIVSRPIEELQRGVPAILGTSAILLLLWYNPGDLEGRKYLAGYISEAEFARKKEELETAKLLYRQVLRISPSNRDALFAMGLIMEKEGDLVAARKVMRDLAPVGATGIPAAHLWLVRDRIKQPMPIDILSLATIEHDLEQVIKADLGDVQSMVYLAQIMIQTNRREQGIRILTRAANKQPELLLNLAMLHFEQNEPEKGRVVAKRAHEELSSRISADPSSLRLRLKDSRSLMLLGQFDEAERSLVESMNLAQDEEEREEYRRELLLQWNRLAVSAVRDSRDNLTLALRVLDRALTVNPDDLRTINNIGLIAREVMNNPEELQTIKDMLQNSLVNSGGSGSTHVILGGIALLEKQMETAQYHLEIAMSLAPESAALANNLAWMLSHEEEPQLEEALALANRALKVMPERPEFLDTRGEIYLRMKRFPEAISDLEKAVKGSVPQQRIHESLAEAYESIGQSGIATKHRERAAAIEEESGN